MYTSKFQKGAKSLHPNVLVQYSRGWDLAHSLIAHSLISSFAHFAQIKWATVSTSLRSLKTNVGCERIAQVAQDKLATRERIAQVAQDKWATVSDLLRLLMINEQMSDSLKYFWQKI